MRLDINLASQPYEDARQFWMRWGTAVGVAGLVTLVLVTMTITGWINARQDHRVMARERTLIAQRDQLRANAEQFLNRPENRTTRDESQVLNQLIERKAFSWTLVLENLEKVMPPRVHLVAISPELDEDNTLALKMTVAGDSRDRALELPVRMEDSKRFAQTHIIAEHYVQQTASGDTEQFEIAAVYIPEAIPVGQPAKKVESKAVAEEMVKSKSNTKTVKIPTPKPMAPRGNQH
jgi:type IV pilus assembly protein PilN